MATGEKGPKGRRWSDRLVEKVKRLESDLDAERTKGGGRRKRARRPEAGRGGSADPLLEARRRWEEGFEGSPPPDEGRETPRGAALKVLRRVTEPVSRERSVHGERR